MVWIEFLQLNHLLSCIICLHPFVRCMKRRTLGVVKNGFSWDLLCVLENWLWNHLQELKFFMFMDLTSVTFFHVCTTTAYREPGSTTHTARSVRYRREFWSFCGEPNSIQSYFWCSLPFSFMLSCNSCQTAFRYPISMCVIVGFRENISENREFRITKWTL